MALAQQFAAMQNADAIANFLHLSEQMRRKQNRGAALFQRDDEILNIARARWVDCAGWLIQHENFRMMNQRLR